MEICGELDFVIIPTHRGNTVKMLPLWVIFHLLNAIYSQINKSKPITQLCSKAMHQQG